ncbi:hypothetical protein GMD88_17470 [Pseudoflavonifractor sp. BIOML-A6]|nr:MULTISPECIES: minor capsid protein [unclassified Pseudoflavonifractor]MTQ98586.1 hypothetical protein [Pseudoflavonifractor sp. BIOML-A16]MTR07861.1 hypothetical protein [Pseudoflavonifractor sp. BIOML-A15]MTR34052.1 hypothetical protein [Pseudoflavonifractor sp. BIOML-A14]MTR74810.1 hypothetical protein [Pseudoflavonifractor sp. BIOML-A18]MTS66037.1 hypothetical protein [Pseudoflavonifractor sp. BIOML-A5]MTS73355.1 hypothetical protein [Pseudoflavonifractor sp. BIOML-A8]MTS92614.1 hypoth
MSATGKVRLDMKPIRRLLKEKGLAVTGDVQRFHTANVLRRIIKYMPYRTGATIKLTQAQTVISKPEIVTDVPYGKYLYYGKVMVGAPPKRATDRDLRYTKTKNPLAGPFWDRALTAAEGAAMVGDLQRYIRMKG